MEAASERQENAHSTVKESREMNGRKKLQWVGMSRLEMCPDGFPQFGECSVAFGGATLTFTVVLLLNAGCGGAFPHTVRAAGVSHRLRLEVLCG